MPRKGRELEELVATLEKGLSGSSIKITSPDFVEDIVLEEKREVDVSLRFTMGSHDFLLVFECRDHKKTQDVMWIEQLATKRDDICVNKLIAVSSNGFSENARKKAHAKNIELRTLKEIDPKEILGWFQAKKLTVFSLKWNIIKVDIAAHSSLNSSQNEDLEKFIKSSSGSLRSDTKFIYDPKIDCTLSVNDCIICNESKIIRDFNPTDKKMIIQFNICPQDNQLGFFISTPGVLIRMGSIQLKLEIWLEFSVSKIISASSYDNENNQLAQIVKFEDIKIDGAKKSCETHLMVKDGKNRLEFFLKDKN
ncbi:restriction endonuclease [Methanosarcina sp.]|uniref:restriction endonuclease n=1 Tax=Methanosarcina sp. TaxID=2213 RepID=UPI0029882378|nr:restriction endonuclease [Methanosarcina sp.]MDW5549484.1 restriction endonuclease [Methanosarcina sp.]MDW5553518.1 restriction endonuclease [Methanosarcina sp.]MDW5558677.1 restriction endonuclease [Methanosarcina sp.]